MELDHADGIDLTVAPTKTSSIMTGQPTPPGPRTPPKQKGLIKGLLTHWFSFIRPAIKPFFLMYTPEFTNMIHWKIPMFNRKYIFKRHPMPWIKGKSWKNQCFGEQLREGTFPRLTQNFPLNGKSTMKVDVFPIGRRWIGFPLPAEK